MHETVPLGNVEIHKPRDIVLKALEYKTNGSVLDLGCGYGRHSLLLAHKGFRVTAVDTDGERLAGLQRKAEQLGVSIRVVQDDVLTFDPGKETYDMILSTMVLHFLSREEDAKRVAENMQSWTRQGGINVICSYTDRSQPDLRPFLPNVEALRTWYAGWKELHFEELPRTDIEVDGPDKGKLVWRAYLIAQKL